MCFSTSVSFGAGAVLGLVGVLAIKKVQSPAQFAFAAIPILFSIQQFAEGFVWLSLTNKVYEGWGTSSINLFLVFAQVLWPIWVPLSVWLVEKEAMPKKVLLGLLGMGVLLAMYLSYCLFYYHATAEIVSYHISYTIFFPIDRTWTSAVYVAVTVFPLFISSQNKFYLLGVAIVASLLFSIVFYTNYLISVWCFFAAINSMIVLYLMSEMNKNFNRSFNLSSNLNPKEEVA
jgi:hypothetical protein